MRSRSPLSHHSGLACISNIVDRQLVGVTNQADGLTGHDNEGVTVPSPCVFLEQPVHLDDKVTTTKSVVLADCPYSGVPDIPIDSTLKHGLS